ncbi:hypothetical protein RUM44_013027 [Polyplax serrata]|uniref:Uncharacterized protein n=1 Tax=Polyplax serrata TaxID=468196 RepID=A0ABR1BHS2_POLSC
MPRRNESERIIPKQNKTLIAGICCCQLTVVLSLVAFIYLSVAIYMPSFRAFKSGFEPIPVTCQTVETVMVNNCSWASCGEWCLTKTTGFCPQIYVTVRRNGTDMVLENCSRMSKSSCPPARPETLHRYNCNNGKECDSLTGLFNCSLGHCINISEIYQCDYKTETTFIDSEKDNAKLNGYFECRNSRCAKIKKTMVCDRYCQKITTSGMNVYVVYDNDLYSADCQRMVTSENLTNVIWSEEKTKKVLFLSCAKVDKIDNFTLRGVDCINGTLLSERLIPKPFINHTVFWSIYHKSKQPVDPQEIYLPHQQSLTIYNLSRLYINLDGCINTLKGECKEFLASHGNDGRNRTGQSRFPCFYNKENSAKAIARYDMAKTKRELIIALVVPLIFFISSFISLIMITKSVTVGDDAVLRCELFSTDDRKNERVKIINRDAMSDNEFDIDDKSRHLPRRSINGNGN